jgi:plasmid stability protein
MATITVRNIPDEVIEMIKERARKNRRSMEQEVRSILASVVHDREQAMRRIESLWKKQKRSVPKEEIDKWLGRARKKENT